MIRLVRVSYGTPWVLRDVSLHLPRGTLGVVVGPMGAGKTTLLRLCACDLMPDSGSVILAGVDTRHMGSRAQQRLRQATGLITPQLPLLEARTVLDSMVAPMLRRGVRWGRAVRDAFRALDELDALHLARAAPTELSAGESNVVCIARAIASRPSLVLADEPLSFLAPHRAGMAMEALTDRARRGSTVLIVSGTDAHVPRDARVWHLHEGVLGSFEIAASASDEHASAVLKALLGNGGAT